MKTIAIAAAVSLMSCAAAFAAGAPVPAKQAKKETVAAAKAATGQAEVRWFYYR